MIHDGIELSRDEGHKQSIIIYGFQCKNNACEETYIYMKPNNLCINACINQGCHQPKVSAG